eukprot:s631_g8.t1
MEVCFLASGETLSLLDADEFQGKTAKLIKQSFAAQLGVPRFRQKLFSEGGSEILDDEVLASAPLKVQLVVLEFWPQDAEQSQSLLSVSTIKDSLALEKLLQCPVNPNLKDEQGKSALFHAARKGCVASVQLLLEAAAEVDAPGGVDGMTALHKAALGGHLPVVHVLLEAGANQNQPSIPQAASPLYLAAQSGHHDVLCYLLEARARTDLVTSAGATPLHVAAAQNHPVIVRTLLESGAEKNQATNCGESPLFVACQRGHLDVVRCLLDYGVDKDQAQENGATPLFIASERAHIDTIRLLLEVGANMNQPRNTGATPLHTAAEGGHLEVVRLLIEAGAEKDLGKVRNNPKGHRTRDQRTHAAKKPESGSTPLHSAAQAGHVDIVRFLLEAGANKDQTKDRGATPLHVAASQGHLEVVRLLIESGADSTITRINGTTALDVAHESGHMEIVYFLSELEKVPVEVWKIEMFNILPDRDTLRRAVCVLSQRRNNKLSFLDKTARSLSLVQNMRQEGLWPSLVILDVDSQPCEKIEPALMRGSIARPRPCAE